MRLRAALLWLLAPALAAPNPRRPWSRRLARIIGGAETSVAKHPWQLSLAYDGSHRCGASVISAAWALTAAHCVDGLPASQLAVRAGSTYRDSGGSVLGVAQTIKNRWYYPSAGDYDIAVIRPVEPFPLGPNVQPVDLPEAGFDPPGGLAVTVTGWGATVTGGTSPTALREVDISVIDRATCQQNLSALITKRMVCAGEQGKSVCNGDSGGPLVNGATQVGIVSWGGFSCEGYGAVYANVGELRAWVTNTTGV